MSYSELQIHSSLLDQPAFDGTPTKLFICSSPRSGSWMLCRYMIHAGLGIPAEYFNIAFMEPLARRFGLNPTDLHWRSRGRARRFLLRRMGRNPRLEFIDEYIRRLARIRTVNGIFASKIQYADYKYTLCNPVGTALLNRGVFIYLYRKDLISQGISWHLAKLSNKWGATNEKLGSPQCGEPLDSALIYKRIEEIAFEDAGWRAFFLRYNLQPIRIAYEDLMKNQEHFLRRIARAAHIDDGGINLSYSETGPYADNLPGYPSKSEIRRRFMEKAAEIRQSDTDVECR